MHCTFFFWRIFAFSTNKISFEILLAYGFRYLRGQQGWAVPVLESGGWGPGHRPGPGRGLGGQYGLNEERLLLATVRDKYLHST